jgi:hypothetical protein
MRARQLISDGSYGPEALKVVFKAFDDAWETIAGNFGEDPSEIEAARLKLANIILSFPHDEVITADRIKNAALQMMALSYRSRSA